MRKACLSLAAFAAAVAPRAAPAQPLPGFFHVENPARLEAIAGRARARVVFIPGAAEKAAELRQRLPSAREEGGALVAVAEAYAPSREEPGPADRAASWLVDFDEPDFAPLRKAIVERYGERPAADDLRRFTAEHVTKKDFTRGLDLASRVARKRQGDCTEHAVLLAALARLFGLPARVVLGLALVQRGEAPLAAGHAWVEVHEGGAWRPFDATDLPASALRIPFSTVRDEGPGFAFALMQQLNPLHVASVTLEPTLEPASDGAARRASRSAGATSGASDRP